MNLPGPGAANAASTPSQPSLSVPQFPTHPAFTPPPAEAATPLAAGTLPQGGGHGSPAAAPPPLSAPPAAASPPPSPAAALPPPPPLVTLPPAPVAQLAPALVSLSRTDGSSVLTLRLEPASLGQVEVRITRPPDGPAGVAVTATNPDTLLLLVRDQPALTAALGRAGIAIDPGSLSFHLAPPPAVPAAPAAPPGGQVAQGGFGPSPGSGGAAGRETAPRRRRSGLASQAAAAGEAATSRTPAQRWLRAGLDITA
ncbi:MAG: flagellar hook-length control protein FliK [Acetobacteraceae bacterium]